MNAGNDVEKQESRNDVFVQRDSNERRSERPTIIIWFRNTTAILLIAHTSYEMHLLQGEQNYKVEKFVLFSFDTKHYLAMINQVIEFIELQVSLILILYTKYL